MSNNLLIISEDLEQKYHRGIAYYAKSLLRATHALGYENYLLTGAPQVSASPLLKELSIIKHLIVPTHIDFGRKKKLLHYLKKYLFQSRFEETLLDRFEKVYSEEQRLDYLQYIKGFMNKPSQYAEFDFHLEHFKRPVTIDVASARSYRAVMTTSPSPIKIKNTPLIQTLHDIIPLSTHFHPTTPHQLELIHQRIVKMLTYSDYICSVSAYSRQEIVSFFPGFEHKIIATPIAVPIDEEMFNVAQNDFLAAALLATYGLEQGEFLFYVGSLEDRKNIDRMILSYQMIKQKIDIPLVLAGEIGSAYRHLYKQIHNSKGVIFLDKINDVTKLILLRSARAFLFPSLYEGFGIPPLEAMYMGCPVLTSHVTSLPEVCGDAAVYVDPYSVDDMASKIEYIANDRSLQEDLRNKGKERVKLFSNEAYSQRLKNVLDLV